MSTIYDRIRARILNKNEEYLAGIALGIYDKTIFDQIKCDKYEPLMEEERWKHKKYGWKKIIQSACEKN